MRSENEYVNYSFFCKLTYNCGSSYISSPYACGDGYMNVNLVKFTCSFPKATNNFAFIFLADSKIKLIYCTDYYNERSSLLSKIGPRK